MHLPLLSGGVGCPNLADRTVLQLAVSYLRVSLWRNVIGRAAIRSLLDKRGQGMEGPAPKVRLAELGLELDLVEEGGAFGEARLWTEGELEVLRGLSWVVAATDGSQQGSRLGAAFVLWHPDHGIFFRAWLGLHTVEGHSTDAEWLAKLLVYHTLRGWLGPRYVPSDSTGALACKENRGPKPGTIMYVLYRQCAFSPVARGAFEMWIRAQHDSEEKDQLALLNKEADHLADLGAASAVLFTVPLLALLKGRVLGHVAGRVLLSPAAGMERVYTDCRE